MNLAETNVLITWPSLLFSTWALGQELLVTSTAASRQMIVATCKVYWSKGAPRSSRISSDKVVAKYLYLSFSDYRPGLIFSLHLFLKSNVSTVKTTWPEVNTTHIWNRRLDVDISSGGLTTYWKYRKNQNVSCDTTVNLFGYWNTWLAQWWHGILSIMLLRMSGDKSWRNGGAHVFLAVKKRGLQTRQKGQRSLRVSKKKSLFEFKYVKPFLLLLIAW